MNRDGKNRGVTNVALCICFSYYFLLEATVGEKYFFFFLRIVEVINRTDECVPLFSIDTILILIS